MPKDSTGRLLDLFADLLEYPGPATLQKAGMCLEQLQATQPEAGSFLESFYHGMEKRSTGQMAELYTSTFDMQPVCFPYVGYHLFGESYKRGAFMAQLNQAYHSSAYSAGTELPDHVSVVLRFLGLDTAMREDDFGQTLLREGLAPALEKMADALKKQVDNPYAGVISALLLVLADTPEKELGHA
jgi:nitrate reductase molybdenum cofactor assembly chaperone NarJ/NarW